MEDSIDGCIYTLDPNILVCLPHTLLCGLVCPNRQPSTNQNQQLWLEICVQENISCLHVSMYQRWVTPLM